MALSAQSFQSKQISVLLARQAFLVVRLFRRHWRSIDVGLVVLVALVAILLDIGRRLAFEAHVRVRVSAISEEHATAQGVAVVAALRAAVLATGLAARGALVILVSHAVRIASVAC
jgi:hypothetical protein